MKPEQAWQAALGQFQMEMPKAAFDTWVRNAEFISYEDGSFIIGVKNAYARDWLESRLLSAVTRLLTGIMNRTVEVRFAVWQGSQAVRLNPEGNANPAGKVSVEDNESETAEEEEWATDDFQQARNEELQTSDDEQTMIEGGTGSASPRVYCNQIHGFNSRYNFETFVVGASNRLAHAASLAVAEKSAQVYNPLFLYGGVGLGKTHLLHAIGNLCCRRGLQVLYVSSEEFTNDLINAIRTHATQAFREKYRQIDVLLVDDIQFIAGKESTQEEFFHTFNTLHGQEKQIVITSDRPPKALMTLEERLCSRFQWGLTADIQPPDYETRLAILRSKAERSGCRMPGEMMGLIARRVQSNIRELEGALTRVAAFADLSGLPVTPQLVETALVDLLPQRSKVQPNEIIRQVAESFDVSMDEMLGRDRSRQIALPRQIAMYLLREEANLSLPQIGDALGGRDHTTIMYGCEKVTDMLERDDRLRRKVIDLKERIYS
jgi:chromosomal replication initiator protein